MMEDKECPLCGELLILNREGTMKNKITGDFIYVYTCEECNQAFAEDNDEKFKLIPYDADMKSIKNECKVCKIVKNYNQEGIFLLNVNTAYYEFHCINCSKIILQDWLNRNSKNKSKVTEKNIQAISELYDFEKNNEMLQELSKNPDKYKEIMDKFKESLDKLGKEKSQSSEKNEEARGIENE